MANRGRGPGLWVALAGIVVITGALAAYFLSRRDAATPSSVQTVTKPVAGAASATPSPSAPAAAPGGEAAQRTDLTIADLLRNAATALSERRYIDPPDNSAVDFYLLVLGRDANNASAQEGLRELFPLAAGEIEQKINAGELDDGRRAIDLLGKFDSNNYTLTILRNKLDLKKKQMDREQEKRDQEKALAANAAKNPSATTPATTPTSTAPAATTPAAATESKPAVAEAAAKPAASAPASAKPATASASTGETRAAIPVSQPPPRYPADAFRARQEGWVEVAFTVAADGSVKDGSVITANPTRVFNSAALRGITDWKFQPRLENGQPVEQQIRARIEFKLPGK